MLRALLPLPPAPCSPRSPQPARAAAGDARLAGRPGRRRRRPRSSPIRAPRVDRARELAGPDGAVLATGSIYLVADLLGASGAPEGVGAVNERGPSVLAMIALVAVVVALVILVFFAHRLRLRPGFPVTPAVLRFRSHMLPLGDLRHQERQRQHGRQRRCCWSSIVIWFGADLLDVRRRPAPDRRPDARRLRDRRVAVPVRRDDRLPDRPPARVPRRRAAARAGDDRRRGASRPASTTSCARTATTRSRRTTCAARAACASSRSAATRAASRSTRRGASARSARPRRARRRRPRSAARRRQTTDQSTI